MTVLLRYIAKKIAIGIPVILGVTIILFITMRVVPADPITLLAGERVTQERIEELKIKWGLDQPLHIQYLIWLSHIIRGDMGISIVTKQPVYNLIVERLPYTLQLTLTSLILAYIIGIPVGVYAALKRGGLGDYAAIGFSTFFYSIPNYWLGLMLMIIFGLYMKILPISGAGSLQHLILPVLSLSLPSIATIVRLIRAEMLEVLMEDYVRTAFAKGLPSSRVYLRHALRNALIPVTVLFFLNIPWLIGGAVVIETVFAWPGMGRLLYNAIIQLDYPVIQGVIFIIAVLTVISNTLGDIILAIMDPRIRLERGAE